MRTPSLVQAASLLGEGSCDHASGAMECVFAAGDALVLRIADYRRAIDRRRIELIVPTAAGASYVLVYLFGRHVGALEGIIATGRSFRLLAHCSLEGGSPAPRRLLVQANFKGALTASRMVHPTPYQAPRFLPVAMPAQRDDLFDGEPHATHWARAWGLSPRLAKVAVALMAGMAPAQIAGRVGLSEHTVRTYTKQLLAKANLQSRNQLHRAAMLADC